MSGNSDGQVNSMRPLLGPHDAADDNDHVKYVNTQSRKNAVLLTILAQAVASMTTLRQWLLQEALISQIRWHPRKRIAEITDVAKW
jgi:hypothetical protein